MTTQQEAAIAAIIAKYEPSITGNGYNRKYYSDESVCAMLAEALAEKAQEPVACIVDSGAGGEEVVFTSAVTKYRMFPPEAVKHLLYTSPPSTEAAAEAAALAMQRQCVEVFEQAAANYAREIGPHWAANVTRARSSAATIRTLKPETGALREMMVEVANASADAAYMFCHDGTEPALDAIVDRILAGKGEVK